MSSIEDSTEGRCHHAIRILDGSRRPCALREGHPGAHQHAAGVTWTPGGGVPVAEDL